MFNVTLHGRSNYKGSTTLIHDPIVVYVKFLNFKMAQLFCVKLKLSDNHYISNQNLMVYCAGGINKQNTKMNFQLQEEKMIP